MKVLILVFLILVASCGGDQVVTDSEVVIQFPRMNHDEIELDELILNIDSITIFPENDLYLNRIMKVICTKSEIYIYDGLASSIIVFDRLTGNQLRKISNTGKGYSKYVKITDFDIDTARKILSLSDGIGMKFITYSIVNFEFIKEISLSNIQSYKFVFCGNGNLMFTRNFGFSRNPKYLNNLLVFDTLNKLVNSYLPYTNPVPFYLGARQIFCKLSDTTISILPTYSNSIYSYNGTNLSKKYKLEFTDGWKEENEIIKESKSGQMEELNRDLDFIKHLNFLETDRSIFFDFKQGETMHKFLYDKSQKNIVSIKNNNRFLDSIPLTITNDNRYLFLEKRNNNKAEGNSIKIYFVKM